MAFQIVEDIFKHNNKYKISRRTVSFKLNIIPEDVEDPESWIKNGIKDILDYIIRDVNPGDKVGFTFTSDYFHKDGYIVFQEARQISFDDIWDLLGSIYQSNADGFHSETFRMTMTVVKPYEGSGRGRNYITYEEECAKRRGIVTIKNTDNMCLPRAVVVGIAYALNSSDLNHIRRNIRGKQDQKVRKLLADMKMKVQKGGCGIEELQKFQQHLTDFKITVYQYGFKGRSVLFEGPDSKHKINLLYHNNHFNVITNLKSAFVCIYYCELCHVPYNTKDAHRCSRNCPCCQSIPPCEKTKNETFCCDCNRLFRSTQCYNNHKVVSKTKSLCNTIKRCKSCLKTFNNSRKHVCGEFFCRICKIYHSVNHYCNMQPDIKQPRTENLLFIFFDLETRQDDKNSEGENIHTPNLCVFQQRCNICIDEVEIRFCQKCGHRQYIFKENIMSSFMNHIFLMRKTFKNVVAVAHNGKGFDFQFVLKYIIEQTDVPVNTIMRGTKILMLKVYNIKFIDSLNYFPMPLSLLPKAFDLGQELKKGHFPHLFNTLTNSSYVGRLPDIEYYSIDRMKGAERETFLQWYDQNKNNVFNMERELLDYCISDVDILTRACLKFRKMFLKECKVDPFLEACTIASATALTFRRNFLKSDTIGLVPRKGYRKVNNQSKIATMWLIWEEQRRSINIIHSVKQKEAVICGVDVDGYCKETNQVFEFYGCFWHGHSCQPGDRDQPIYNDPGDTLNFRYERTLMKANRLKNLGFQVLEMWECDFIKILLSDKETTSFLQNHPLIMYTPLNSRDALYGGRTGNTRTYYKCKPGEKIKYFDVNSLYPWVCKYGRFPVKHPKIHIGNEECSKVSLEEVGGLIKCKILPPSNLYHPVLPKKMNEKLMFVLCNKCGEEMSEIDCNHSEEEKALRDTYVIDEVVRALEKGYRMMEIYEIWTYEMLQYNEIEKCGGLFTDMMNKFVKMKTQASGWPAEYSTEEQKQRFIRDFFETEGILLEYEEIINNPCLRSLAKLILNSFWGKFAQRENMSKTAIVRQPSELYALLNDSSMEVNEVREINEDVLLVSWTRKEDACDSLASISVPIAAYVTSQARLRLYSYLEKLGDRVLYYDTDSVIYISRHGEEDLATGPFLGDLSDELQTYGESSYITEFISGGPKNYSFSVYSPAKNKHFEVCKIKGFSLNYEMSKVLNFYTMKNMVLDDDGIKTISVSSENIRRNKVLELVNKHEIKKYRIRSEKRRFTENYDSFPYGFKKQKSQ